MKRFVVLAALPLFALGCAAQPRGAAPEALAQCTDLLTMKGQTWKAVTMSRRLDRPLAGAPIHVTQVSCDDGAGVSRAHVTLRRIGGISPHQALFRLGTGYEDVVYVRGEPDEPITALPHKVQTLIVKG